MNFFLACVLLGFGIAIDVALATLVFSAKLVAADARRFWVVSVTATHVVLPMIGYYGFAFLVRILPRIEMLLGIVAVLMVAWFLYDQFTSWLREDMEENASAKLDFRAVLAVSWDALWSGPAKSAQALDWSPGQIAISFVIAGAVVGLIAYASVLVAPTLRASLTGDREISREAGREVVARALEFTIIAYFGLLALVNYILGIIVADSAVLAISAIVTSFLFLFFRRRLHAARLVSLRREQEAG